MSEPTFDVAVVGAGPAGAFAAFELARAGASVVLVDPGGTRPRLEGLGARVADLLRLKGLEGALSAATAPVTRQVRWAGLAERANSERLVRRERFDPFLRAAADAAGARRVRARLARVDRADPADGVALSLSDGSRLRARLMIEARGRQAPARAAVRGPRTLSIAGLASRAGDALPSAEVVATPEGWLWAASHPELGRWLQISVDADSLTGAGTAALTERISRFLSQPEFADGAIAALDVDAFADGLFARHAGCSLAAGTLAPPVLPIGDASVALDPLSGHGLFWALSSALAAVPMAASLLDDPADRDGLVARFHHDRVVGTFWRQARVGRDFYRLETGLAGHPFWRARAAWPDGAPAHAPVEEPRLERRVVVEGNRLKERPVLVTALEPDGVAFVGGVPVAKVLTRIEQSPLAERTATRLFPELPPDRAATALGWLTSRGLLGRPLAGASDGARRAADARTTPRIMRDTA